LRIMVHDYAGHPFQVDLSRELARRGHIVWHVYFAGDKGPKGRMERQPGDPDAFEIIGVDIGRDYSKADFISRRANDIRYARALTSRIAFLRPEIVLSGNTPLDAQGAIIAATHRVDGIFVNWVQDFYSLAIQRLLARRWLGLGDLVGAYYRRMGERQLASSDAVVLIAEEFRPALTGFADRADRVAVIANWGALADLPMRPKGNPWSVVHGLARRFVFLYSGTLGLKHNPQALVDLADAFADRPDVAVVVAAGGLGRDRLDAILAERPRANLMTLPVQPFADFADVLGAADVFVALLEEDAGSFSAPSKVLSYLCAGRPILLAAPLDNVASRTVNDAGAGLAVPPGEVAELIRAAERLYESQAERQAMAAAGRAHAEANFDIQGIADRFEAVFRQVTARRAPQSPIQAFVHLPPPLHGVSVVSAAVVDWMAQSQRVEVVDLSFDELRLTPSRLIAYLGPMAAVIKRLGSPRLRRSQWCYLALSGGPRQAFDLLVIAVAKARGLRVSVHHHSMAYLAGRSTLVAVICCLLSGQDACIFLGERHREGFIQRYRLRAHAFAISNAAFVPIERRAARSCAPAEIRLGFLANLEATKGLDRFLAAARVLSDGGHVVRTVIAGPFRDEACQALVAQAMVEGLALYLGPVGGPAKQAFFDGIDIFVFPSRYRNETEPMVVLEAMAQGVPVIASAVGCIPDMLPPGFAIPLGGDSDADAAALATAIGEVMVDYQAASRAMLDAFARRREASANEQIELAALLASG
jgi:colanic acid biosynthesis glycosyl transferase WcaI